MELLSEKKKKKKKKMETLHVKLHETVEAAISRYPASTNFSNMFIICLWLKIIRKFD